MEAVQLSLIGHLGERGWWGLERVRKGDREAGGRHSMTSHTAYMKIKLYYEKLIILSVIDN